MTRVLIADDFPYLRLMLRDLLTMNDFEVVGEAENGAEAVEKYDLLKPDIVLMDVAMRGGNGLEAARIILNNYPNAKIAIMSAVGRQEMLEEAREMGINHYLLKPFSLEEVIATLNKMNFMDR